MSPVVRVCVSIFLYIYLFMEKLGSFDMQFDLQVGVGTLVVAKPLDAEVQSVYNMTVQVTDGTNIATTQVLVSQICFGVFYMTHQYQLAPNSDAIGKYKLL